MRIHKSPLFPTDFLIEHHNFIKTKNNIFASVMNLHQSKIPLVTGPSGVGKSTLIKKVAYDLNEFVSQNPDLGFAPPVIIEARSPETSEFQWKSFYLELLEKLGEPLIYKKVSPNSDIARLRENKQKNNSSHIKIDELRSLVEECIDARNPIAILVDECQSIANKNKTHKAISNNLDVVKSFSNSKQNHVKPRLMLFGNYSAYDLLVTNGQLSRRIDLIDFARYKLEDGSPERFGELIQGLIELGYPLSETLLQYTTYCANHCLGCIGIFIEWLTSAHQKSYQLNKRLIDIDSLKLTRMKNVQLSALAWEIKQFENLHHRVDEFDEASFFSSKNVELPPTNRKYNRKPGVRSPKRDLISAD